MAKITEEQKLKIAQQKKMQSLSPEERLKLENDEFESKFLMDSSELRTKDFGKIEYIPTSTLFDYLGYGFVKGEVAIISAPTGEGKSLSLQYLAEKTAKNSRVVYIGCENDIRIDQQRSKNFKSDSNFKYGNTLYNKPKELFESLCKYVAEGRCDIIFIDAINMELKQAKDGIESKNLGMDLMKALIKNAKISNTAVVLTWQLNRGCKLKDIDDISTDDMELSLGISQSASTMYVVKYNPKTKKKEIKLIKTRFEKNYDIDRINFQEGEHGAILI